MKIISLTKDEIAILNELFVDPEPDLKLVFINQIIRMGRKEYFIEPSTKFAFEHSWCDDDPYAYSITDFIIDGKNESSVVHYGWRGGFLDGRGFIAYFSKKNNHWEKTIDEFEWMS
ncbi:hypothetical protein AGMMS50268_39970 [Spirochaetia bacterium]|nr:hypothetical protein AGMMS50268_39970 [Spirochaetia bacterium]